MTIPDETSFGAADLMLRLGAATLCGLMIGFEREVRGKDAGLRTHALVALSSAVITVSALSLYAAVRADGGDADPLRVIQGLAQAIGFIAAGAIIVMRGDVRNLTTAASVWLSAALGIAAGAAQYRLVAAALALAFAVLILVGLLKRHILPDKHRSDDD
ncbi:MAG: MgtC/SapB family protein [Methylobacterium sp.]|uniref:MgtC/SapB family protein n=1 Tax=Methylobacterium sp. TaxID=409 RepID=UPI00258FD06D|nr:MgtC/SapB family protein [Methylobacterium sp.]MBY0298065.1 MgtC/SapB family protein [Methylobacterium sp.]